MKTSSAGVAAVLLGAALPCATAFVTPSARLVARRVSNGAWQTPRMVLDAGPTVEVVQAMAQGASFFSQLHEVRSLLLQMLYHFCLRTLGVGWMASQATPLL
jgi:hypothetical protein